jgi:hypothetical protein
MATSGPMERTVRSAARARKVQPADRAALELAVTYAKALDDGTADLDVIGPKLLAVLDALGLTSRSRALMTKGASDGSTGPDPLDEIRQRRAARKHRAEDLDATAS